MACTSEATNNKGAISFTAEDNGIELEPSSKQSNSCSKSKNGTPLFEIEWLLIYI